MGFAMRMNFVDVVVSDSLKHYYVDGKKMGYQFDIRLSYYRGHFLSVIDEFKVKVDDFEVPAERIKFCINRAHNAAGINRHIFCHWRIIICCKIDR